MERQGMLLGNKSHRNTVMRGPSLVLVFLAVLSMFVGNGWAECSTGWQEPGVTMETDVVCEVGTCTGNGLCSARASCPPSRASITCPPTKSSGNYVYSGVSVGTGIIYYSGGQSRCVDNANLCIQAASLQKFTAGCYYSVRCGSQCEADSVANYQPCLDRGGTWNSTECKCDEPPPSSSSQDNQSSSSQGGSSSSSPPAESSSSIDCQNQTCCDSLNRYHPVETDTSWLGCVPLTDSDKCMVYDVEASESDTAITAECNGASRYEVCTKYWQLDGTSHCKQLPSTNCMTYDVRDSNCTGILCYKVQQHGLSSLDFNHLTQCYTGTEYVQNYVYCTNGNREEGSSYQRAFTVCQSYLDELGITISDYIAGRSGTRGGRGGFASGGGGSGSGSGGSGSGGSGGSGGTGGGDGTGTGDGGSGDGIGGCVGNGCGGATGGTAAGAGNGMAAGYGGGTSVNALGDTVENSASPGLGGTWSPTTQIVTTYNDSTGETEIIKNSMGGDSTITVNTWNSVRCIGYSGGVATLTNGFATWSCSDVMSCSQALLSASINGGKCSASANNAGNAEDASPNMTTPTITYGDSTTINWNASVYSLLEQGLNMVVSTMNAMKEQQRRQRDSIEDANEAQRQRLWNQTFGEDAPYMNYIVDIYGSINSASSANSNAIATAAQSVNAAISSAASSVGSGLSDVQDAVNSVRTAVNNASTANTNAVSNATTTLSTAVYDVNASISSLKTSLNSASSANSNAIGIVNTSITSAASNASTQRDNIKTTLRDSIHTTNNILRNIENSVSDTGKSIPASIWSVDSNISSLATKTDSAFKVNLENWSNDKLVMIIDTNVQKVADAIDSMKVEVNLDSISVIVEHDTILDSIDARLQVRSSQSMEFVNDTFDLAKVYSQAFDEAKVDTSLALDSSVVTDMRSRSYIDGSDVVDPTNVDSTTSVLNSKLDSSNAVYNARSDSMTRALVDSTLKYSGIDSGGAALRRFFDVPNNGCPRECLDITLQVPQNLGGGETKINFSEYVCDKKILGNYGVLDFVKLVLRILTAYLCLMFIWNAMWYLNTGAKKK